MHAVRAADEPDVPQNGPPRPAGVRRLTADKRREQLLEVALTLFGERGFRATTMDDIALAAGVTKPLVYQHFSSKRALYAELVEQVTRDLLSAIARATARATGPRQQVELGFAAYFQLVVSQEAAFRLIYGREDAEVEEVADAMVRVDAGIAEAIDPLIDAGLDPEHRRLLACAVVGMAEGASRQWLAVRAARPGRPPLTEREAREEAQRLASRMANLAWAGLRSVHAD